MAKQALDQKLADAMAADGGRGNSTRYSDNSAWLPSDGDDDWYDAFHAIDKEQDKTALLSMLRSSAPMSDAVRRHLADLIERSELRKPQGRPRTPSYHVSDAEHLAARAVEDVRSMSHRRNPRRIPYEDAVEKVAKKYGMTYETLHNACQGRRASTRRQQKRRNS